MNKQLIQKIEEIFLEKLSQKTGWGRNQIIKIFKESIKEALLEFVDK